jgi:hypothetical protein
MRSTFLNSHRETDKTDITSTVKDLKESFFQLKPYESINDSFGDFATDSKSKFRD